MDKAGFEKALKEYVEHSGENFARKEIALRPELAGMRIFDEPLFGYALAEDPYFVEAKTPGVIGEHFMAPTEWLSGAKTVVSMFLPFTEQVRAANRQNMDWPADEWLHARVEGQLFQDSVCRFIVGLFVKEGFDAAAPMIDLRFNRTSPITNDKTKQDYYTSNWSERHAAYAAGLGTFGLSKGLITRKGVAGRYVSVITTAVFEPDKRPYTGIYDYCIRCGACVRNCPAKAISLEKGKIHSVCSDFVEMTKEKCAPRFGCGKCQVKVPCETRAPNT